jgi:hypothetical protein
MTVGCVARNQQDCPARKPVGQLSFQSRLEVAPVGRTLQSASQRA